ncbi:MAG: DUF1028 domain-containing protein [Vicinamibacteria bacterium]
MKRRRDFMDIAGLFLAIMLAGPSAESQTEPYFHTFSIAAIDPATGEAGVAVTTRNPCVGNGVPWVRAGVGAVATQASTRTEYGSELLDLIASGVPAERALERALEGDERGAHRQIGVIGLTSGSAQHTGAETRPWSGHRAGRNYVTQGNLLVGPEVLEAVARSFEASEGSGRHLADRLIAALEAGNTMGGDARKGRSQSAAVVVADPREGHSQRPDGVSTHVNVCEHREPVAEMRRIYDAISQSLGYRTLQGFAGKDVLQLEIMLEALGYLGNGGSPAEEAEETALYTLELAAAVDKFRDEEGLSTPKSGSPPGLVDRETVDRLWDRLEAEGKAASIRERFKEITAVTR